MRYGRLRIRLLETGLLTAALMILAGLPAGASWRAESAPDLRQVATAAPAAGAVVIDGQAEEWDFARPQYRFRAEELKTRGRTSLTEEEGSELRAAINLAWDHYYLYVAVEVRGTAPAMPDPAVGWAKEGGAPEGTYFAYEGVSVNLRPYPEVLGSSRAFREQPPLQHGWYDTRFVMSPYREGGQPRTFASGASYAASLLQDGYVVEGRVPFAALGFTPAAGDQLAFCLHVVDADPAGEREARHFLWNVVPSPGGGMWWKDQREGDPIASWGRLRLVGNEGWGATLLADPGGPSPLGELRFLGTVDVFGEGLKVAAVELREADSGRLSRRFGVGEELKGPGTYRVSGTVNVSGLVPGRYELRLSEE